MRKLSDYRDEEALELLADLLEPFTELFKDGDFRREYGRNNIIRAVSLALKRHKGEIMRILARIDGTPVEEYHCTMATLPLRLIELMQDKDLQAVFTSQVETISTETFSSPV